MKKLCLIFFIILGFIARSQNSLQLPIVNSNYVATDALFRKIPEYKEAGEIKVDKYVGVFYYIWQGAYVRKVNDVSRTIAANPKNPTFIKGQTYHWGEPEAGYYIANDPWVIRRNLQMLVNAGVDFIFIDASNKAIYQESGLEPLLEMSLKMRSEGIKTPAIVHLTFSAGAKVMNLLYDSIYSKKKYKELWFIWNGKPLIFGNEKDTLLRPEVKKYFTIKYSWAWTDAKNTPNHWQWIDYYPQDYGWSENKNIPEQITVTTASHPTLNIGKSYHNGKQPDTDSLFLTAFSDSGLYFAEQWKRAIEVNPKVVMVTQWNEWIMGCFELKDYNITHNPLDKDNTHFIGRKLNLGDLYFVDDFNKEYNRDIEPMKNGYTDNYYYQLVANIRKFKGMAKPQPFSGLKSIKIDGNFEEWKTVFPIYEDFPGDTEHRNWGGYDANAKYINNTGRNDIIESRVSYDKKNLFFYVKTKAKLTSFNDKNWMLLFIDVDTSKKTGWQGYDYVINRNVSNDKSTNLYKYINEEWQLVCKLDYSYKENEMEISILQTKLGLNTNKMIFNFHWADNPWDEQIVWGNDDNGQPQKITYKWNEIEGFFINGDSAPDRRFNYRFEN